MPRDMAVKRPHTRIIAVDLYDHVPVWLEEVCIPAHWVAGVRDAAVPCYLCGIGGTASREDEHVVAMEVHWVGDGREVIYDEPDGRRGGEVEEVPGWREGVGELA